jgi:tetratricopeptide (TPR) repeat protein
VAIVPESGSYEYYAAFCLQMCQRKEEALASYGRALIKAPEMETWIRYNRAALYLDFGRLDEAEQDLRRVRVLDPRNAGIVVYWSRLQQMRNARPK